MAASLKYGLKYNFFHESCDISWGIFSLSTVPWSHIINNSSFQLNSCISKNVVKDKNNGSALPLKKSDDENKAIQTGTGTPHVCLALWLVVFGFFFHGKKIIWVIALEIFGVGTLLQITVPFTKANSGKVFKFHSDHFLHHFLMGLSYSYPHPKWRIDLF